MTVTLVPGQATLAQLEDIWRRGVPASLACTCGYPFESCLSIPTAESAST